MKKNSSTMKIALCGVMGALIVTVMLMGYIIPFATYMCPALAARFLMPIAYEYSPKTAFTLYAATAFLCIFLVAETEMAFSYIFIFAPYVPLKMPIDRIKSKFARFFAKLGYITAALAVCYTLLLAVFPTVAVLSEFQGYTMPVFAGLFGCLILVFFIWDKALQNILLLYIYRFRKKLFKS